MSENFPIYGRINPCACSLMFVGLKQRPGDKATFQWNQTIASYPGLPSQLFSQPWQKAWFATAAKKAVREGLGTRLIRLHSWHSICILITIISTIAESDDAILPTLNMLHVFQQPL